VILGPDWVFVSVPKCATHSLYELLTTVYKGEQHPGPYHQISIPRGHTDKRIFTCVRSPYTRTVSAWGRMNHPERQEEDMTFPAFVEWLISSPHQAKPVYQPQATWLAPVLDRATFWRLERLDEDMRASGFDRHEKVPHLWSAMERGFKRWHTDLTPWKDVPTDLHQRWRLWCERDFDLWRG